MKDVLGELFSLLLFVLAVLALAGVACQQQPDPCPGPVCPVDYTPDQRDSDNRSNEALESIADAINRQADAVADVETIGGVTYVFTTDGRCYPIGDAESVDMDAVSGRLTGWRPDQKRADEIGDQR